MKMIHSQQPWPLITDMKCNVKKADVIVEPWYDKISSNNLTVVCLCGPHSLNILHVVTDKELGHMVQQHSAETQY